MTEGNIVQTANFMMDVEGLAIEIMNLCKVNITAPIQGVAQSSGAATLTVDLRKTDDGHFLI